MNKIILLPGALGYAEQFVELKKTLEEQGMEPIAMDLPGHGQDDSVLSNTSVPNMAEQILFKLNGLEFKEPVHIFGHSLGGYIGLYLCLKYPERVQSLFTLGTKWHWEEAVAIKESGFLDPKNLMEKIPKYVEHLKKCHSANWEDVVTSISELMIDLGKNNYLENADLVTIPHLVRIGLGDRDKLVTLDETIKMYKSLNNSELQVFPKTVHPYEKILPETLATAIYDFMKD